VFKNPTVLENRFFLEFRSPDKRKVPFIHEVVPREHGVFGKKIKAARVTAKTEAPKTMGVPN